MDILREDLTSAKLPAGPYRTDKQLLLPSQPEDMLSPYHYVLPEFARLQRHSLLHGLACALKFPQYFGRNWDAAYDCLTDRDWPAGAVVIIEMGIAEDALVDGAALTTLIDIMRDAGEFWSGQGVTLYFLIPSSRADLAALDTVPSLRLG